MSIKSHLLNWQKAGFIDATTTEKILNYERSKQGFQLSALMFGLGAFAIFLGLAEIIRLTSTNWDTIPDALKLAVHTAMNLILAAGIWYCEKSKINTAREIMLFVLATLVLTFIFLIAQIYQIDAPLETVLTLWLAIISPFLFIMARAKFTIICWITALLVTLFVFTESALQFLSPFYLVGVFLTLIPFITIAIGQSSHLQKTWPVWPRMLTFSGYIFTALAVSFAQVAWTDGGALNHMDNVERLKHIVPAFLTGLIGTAALYALHYVRQKNFQITDVFMLASVLLGFAPLFFIPHFYWSEGHIQKEVMGAVVFISYWSLVGWVGVRSGSRTILNAAAVIIAIRLVIIYVNVFSNVIAIGLSLLIIGFLLIAIVIKTNKLMQKMG